MKSLSTFLEMFHVKQFGALQEVPNTSQTKKGMVKMTKTEKQILKDAIENMERDRINKLEHIDNLKNQAKQMIDSNSFGLLPSMINVIAQKQAELVENRATIDKLYTMAYTD